MDLTIEVKMSDIKRVFTQEELINVKHGSLTYYMACELIALGAPITFNRLNINLAPQDIEIFEKLSDKIGADGSHEFTFKPARGRENKCRTTIRNT